MVDEWMASVAGREREDYLGAIDSVSTELEQLFVQYDITYYNIRQDVIELIFLESHKALPYAIDCQTKKKLANHSERFNKKFNGEAAVLTSIKKFSPEHRFKAIL